MTQAINLGVPLNSADEIKKVFNSYISCEKSYALRHDITQACNTFRALFNEDWEALKAAKKIDLFPREGQNCQAFLCDKISYENHCTFTGSEDDDECDSVGKNIICTAETLHLGPCVTSCSARYDSPISLKQLLALANSVAGHGELTNHLLMPCGLEQADGAKAFIQNSVQDLVEELCPTCDIDEDWETFWEQHTLGEPYVDIKDDL